MAIYIIFDSNFTSYHLEKISLAPMKMSTTPTPYLYFSLSLRMRSEGLQEAKGLREPVHHLITPYTTAYPPPRGAR